MFQNHLLDQTGVRECLTETGPLLPVSPQRPFSSSSLTLWKDVLLGGLWAALAMVGSGQGSRRGTRAPWVRGRALDLVFQGFWIPAQSSTSSVSSLSLWSPHP